MLPGGWSAFRTKVAERLRQETFVRVARNSLRVGRTLLQRWWGEAVLAKVRLHVPVDYFRDAEDYRPMFLGGRPLDKALSVR